MTITTPAQLLNALGNNSSRVIIDKGTIANQIAGRYTSLWRATGGLPAQGAIPGTTPAICNSALLGAIGFTNQTAPSKSYLSWMFLNSGNATTTVEIHDRLAHMGGLVLNVTTAQTITGFDLSSSGLNVVADRIGSADYSDVQWWLEVYTDGGATASNATINVTFDDASTGNLNVVAVGGTIRAGMMFSLDALKTTGQQARKIRGVNSVTLSASTTVAGNFGFTATRPRSVMPLILANKTESFDYLQLGFPEIPNDACLMIMTISPNTSSGTLRGGGKIAHG